MKMERRYCKYCGKPIPVEGLSEWRYRAKVYCSGTCRNRSFSESRMSPRITKECPVCHTKFESLACRDKVYCSTKCGYIGAALKKKQLCRDHSCIDSGFSWSEVFRTAEKYHPERFAALHLDRPEYQTEVIQRFTAELISWEKTDRYAWFYNHVLYPDDTLAETIGDGLLMFHSRRSAHGTEIVRNGALRA